jgi:BatD DUF11 like domain
MMIVRFGIGLLLILGIISPVFCQKMPFIVEVSEQNPTVGSYFKVKYSIDQATAKDFEMPDFSPLVVLSGPDLSRKVLTLNGKVTNQTTWELTVEASRPGTYKIRPASCIADKGKVISPPLQITVSAGAPNVLSTPVNGVGLVYELKKSSGYVGQLFVLSAYLVSDRSIDKIQLVQSDLHANCYQEKLPIDEPLRKFTKGGKVYFKKLISREAIYPKFAGSLPLSTLRVRVTASENNKTKDPFLRNELKSWMLETQPITMEVAGLPPAPPTFMGLTGATNATMELIDSVYATGAVGSLELLVESEGDGHLAMASVWGLSDSLEIIESELVEQRQEIKMGKPYWIGKYRCVFSPRVPGHYLLEPKLVYFDTQTHDYQELSVDPIAIDIVQGQDRATSYNSKDPKGKTDIGKIITIWEGSVVDRPFAGSFSYFFLVALPLLAIGGFMAFKRFQTKLIELPKKIIKEKVAIVHARQSLKGCEKLFQAGLMDDYHKSISKTLIQLVADKFHIQGALPVNEAVTLLRDAGFSTQQLNTLIGMHTFCERQQFSRVSGAQASLDTLKEANAWVDAVEPMF